MDPENETIWEDDVEALIEFDTDGDLEEYGVTETLWVLEEDPHGDTEILGLKLFVDVADGQDDPAIELLT